MANFNKVLLMGNLTRDPELRYAGGGGAGSGTAITKFGLATNRTWRTPSGEQQEETTFVDIVVFGRQAETCNEYLSKGRPVFIEGRLSYSTWEDRESGAKRSKLEVVAERVQFLGSRDGGNGGGSQGGGRQRGEWSGGSRDRDASPASPDAAPARGAPSPASSGYDFDDIPF